MSRFDKRRFSTLGAYKKEARDRINTAAGEARARNTTTVIGQMDTYRMKFIEAEAFKAAGYPNDPPNWPWMKAEVQGTGKDRTTACDDIIAKQAAWQGKAATIEQYRLQGIRLATGATTVQEVVQRVKQAIGLLKTE